MRTTCSWIGLAATLVLATASSFSIGQTGKKKPTTAQNQTKGQGQLTGGYIKFGETYSLKDGLNFSILKATYSLDPFPSYEKASATVDKKLVILDVAIKNAVPKDNDSFPPLILIDAAGNKYDAGGGMISLKSNGVKEYYRNLKPGQGLGQPGLNDPLRVAFLVPLDAKITKIIVNEGRLNKNEEVVRYLMAGTDKEADPANVIAVPPSVASLTELGGQIVGKVGIGQPFVSYYSTYQINSVKTTTEAIEEGVAPEEGKQFVLVSVTVKNNSLATASYFDSLNLEGAVIKDSDGEKSQAIELYKGSSNEKFDRNGSLEPGDERTLRYLFQISAKTKPAQLNFAASGPYLHWIIDLSK